MTNTQHTKLRAWLKNRGITQEDAAREMGLTVAYLNSILMGHRPLSRGVKFAFVETYPQTAAILLPGKEEA